MTLHDQLKAAIIHRDTDEKNYDMQIEFVTEHKLVSLQAHDDMIARIEAHMTAHKQFIGEGE